MRIWRYQDPDGTVTMTEAEILATYFAYWSEQMRKAGKADQITEQGCIEDWIVIHWAQQVCTDYRPDHNGECLNCDEWADAHEF